MIDLPPYDLRASRDVDTDEAVLELVDAETQAVALRFTYVDNLSEPRFTSLTVSQPLRAQRLATAFIVQVFDLLAGQGVTTVRIVKPNAPKAYLAYGCELEGEDVLVDLANGTTVDQLRAALA